MKKIKSLFQRGYDGDDRLVRDEVTPGSEWVANGEGRATRKYDGTCCMWRAGNLWKRYDAKHDKPTPPGFSPAQEPDEKTGHWPGWIPVNADNPSDRWHVDAIDDKDLSMMKDLQTYELCGPKVNGNAEGFLTHLLIRHGSEAFDDCPRTYNGIKAWIQHKDIEGVVWHHPDGRMVKIKKKDFGFKR